MLLLEKNRIETFFDYVFYAAYFVTEKADWTRTEIYYNSTKVKIFSTQILCYVVYLTAIGPFIAQTNFLLQW
jgi:hypothetical protein